MSYVYRSVTPITRVTLVPEGARRVATTRPPWCDFGLGAISGEKMDLMAASALHAGHDVYIVVVRIRKKEVADLYVL
jgi:hypothetical protein